MSEYYTYFVGDAWWGFSVWTHNFNCWNEYLKANKGRFKGPNWREEARAAYYKEVKAKKVASNSGNVFPADPNNFTEQLGVPPTKVTTTPDGTPRMVWEPNANTRIRYESHPEGLSPGDPGFNPRHHGEHYHVEMKPDSMTWGQAQRRGLITKGHPDGYTPGSGTGFLPGEPFPGNTP